MPIDRNQPNWYWGAGTEAERLHGPFETMAEARADAIESIEADDSFFDKQDFTYEINLAAPMRLYERIFDGDDVLEKFAEANEDYQSEDGELMDFEPTREQVLELELALNTVFSEWRAKHSIGRSYQLDVLERFVEVALFENQNPPAT